MKSKRAPRVSKKQAGIDERVETIGKLNDQYRKLTQDVSGSPDPQALRELAARFRAEKMPNRAEMICMEAFIEERKQERCRKSVLNGGIIIPEGTTIGYGGTDEIPASIDIPVAVSAPADSLCAGG